MKKEDLLGKKFNRLLVIAPAEPVGVRRRSAWLCQCDCGTQKIVKSDELKSGDTKSCGCWNQEQRSARAQNLYSGNIKYTPRETSARRVWRNRYNDGISFEDFLTISQQNCFYCGGAPNNICNNAKEDSKSSEYARKNGDFVYNGLDRIDNSKPHTKDNVVPSCKWCNYAKRERSPADFELWIETVYHHMKNKKPLR